MDAPARLKWRKEQEQFAAYPTATDRVERHAIIRLMYRETDTSVQPHRQWESWFWRVRWGGWFVETGYGSSKQEAADRATEAWWRNVQTDIPRNVDLEAAMIVARALVQPPPNSLFAEDAEYLRKVHWHLRQVYGQEIAAGMPALANLNEQLTAELARRREAGEYKEPEPYKPSHPVRRRRRR